MVQLWEMDAPDASAPKLTRAVAYYRHSAQVQQENSITIQQDQVRAWAKQHGVEIIREFCDAGRSGLNSEDRPAFTEMMEEWIKRRSDFEYVLCFEASRLGRYPNCDFAEHPSEGGHQHKKKLIYTSSHNPQSR
jgi:DNA invertase Pin-like site-specific DNA recombinase